MIYRLHHLTWMMNQKKTNRTSCSQQHTQKILLWDTQIANISDSNYNIISSKTNKREMFIKKILLKFRCKCCYIIPTFKIQGTDPFTQPRSGDWKSRGRPRLWLCFLWLLLNVIIYFVQAGNLNLECIKLTVHVN